jgi:GT2 family glycosyltransferase
VPRQPRGSEADDPRSRPTRSREAAGGGPDAAAAGGPQGRGEEPGLPEVSVVIPAYNAAQTIRETLESAMGQTLRDLELIVVDDGSTDATAAVVRSVPDPRLRLLCFDNAGVATARNRGVAAAQGRFVAFLDADDRWTERKLEEQHRALLETPDASVAYGWTDFVDENGKFLHPGCHQSPCGDVRAALLMKNFVETGSNILVRREALEAAGGFDPAAAPADDFAMLLRLALQGSRFVAVPRVHVLYRLRGGSLSHAVASMERGHLQALKMLDEAPEALQRLRPHNVKRLFVYLAWRCLQQPVSRRQASTAASYLRKAIHTPPAGLDWRIRAGTLGKILLAFASPALFDWLLAGVRGSRRLLRAARGP